MSAKHRFWAAGAAILLASLAGRGALAQFTTPGAIPDPSTYQGSMQLQQQEQQRDQQVQQQNQQMQQRLDQNYQQQSPGARGAAASGPPPINWWAKPPLPVARNPLIGRWRQVASKGTGASAQLAAGPLGDLMGSSFLAGIGSVVDGAMAGGCESMFGKGVIAFTPDALSWVAPDGHEEVLNHVAYRASGADIVMITRDPGAAPQLFFGLADHDHAVVAVFGCTMERLGGAPRGPGPSAAVAGRTPIPASAPAPAPVKPADAVLKFNVGSAGPGFFTPLAGIQIWVTREDPQIVMGGPPAARLAADCGNVQTCASDIGLLTSKALGSVRTDAQGHAQTPTISVGRYWLVGLFPYEGRAHLWNVPINLQPGENTVVLDQTRGQPIR